jgi:hypothetical protein
MKRAVKMLFGTLFMGVWGGVFFIYFYASSGDSEIPNSIVILIMRFG